ncbi:MAG TPA: response regulator transcription factor [Candidatus Dormibacteraeota bacterium]|nr:response regulator transcription factor [Candidatus Dormibacteraeota bacterium]
MRVLVVEDDEQVASSLRRGLRELGMAVDTVGDGVEAVAAAEAAPYDVIVLDVMLPGRDGYDVARTLRRRRVGSRILMLTGRTAVDDRVQGLDAGADDYLAKPFALKELAARIRALTRRDLADRTATLRAGPILLDTGARRLTVGNRAIELTAKEYAVLEFFMLHRGLVLTREQVLDNVWDWGAESSQNLVEAYISRLRRKLAAAGTTDPWTTLRGAGYRFDPSES